MRLTTDFKVNGANSIDYKGRLTMAAQALIKNKEALLLWIDGQEL